MNAFIIKALPTICAVDPVWVDQAVIPAPSA
jgi:hypothetical protein